MIVAALLAAAAVTDTSSYETLMLTGPSPVISEAAKAAKACHAPITLRKRGPAQSALTFSKMTKHREARACLEVWLDANRDREIKIVWFEEQLDLL